jgi:hypothetical protein
MRTPLLGYREPYRVVGAADFCYGTSGLFDFVAPYLFVRPILHICTNTIKQSSSLPFDPFSSCLI